MAVNKTTIVDNKKITEGPATKNDRFKICAVCLQEILREMGEKPNHKNTKTVTPNMIERPNDISTELGNTIMTIKAVSYMKTNETRKSAGREH